MSNLAHTPRDPTLSSAAEVTTAQEAEWRRLIEKAERARAQGGRAGTDLADLDDDEILRSLTS